ncbi:type IV secretion system protein VirB5 [Bartonella acomydis]|uniref:VirB5 n=1 Tax=Bartonella acomydis TaxID=686234 RepID=A0ABP9MYT3_9HYPH
MKKYGLITLLSLSFTSHTIAQDTEEYYKNALESTQKLNAVKSETAESIYMSTTEHVKKIENINQQLETIKAKTEVKPEEFQALQIQLTLLQAKLQTDIVKLQSLSMIEAKDKKTTEEIREEEAQKQHEELAEQLKQKLESSNVGL